MSDANLEICQDYFHSSMWLKQPNDAGYYILENYFIVGVVISLN